MFRWLTWFAIADAFAMSLSSQTVECQRALEAQITWAWPTESWRDLHVLAAVSGGADSVAMLRALCALKTSAGGQGALYVAHLNHQLRGADAALDQAWLEVLCHRLNVPLISGEADVAALAEDQGDGWESAARQARYDFLLRTAEKLGARWVAVAHTADDQVETVLHRVLRGTGLSGLAAMRRVRPMSPTVTLVRPLLAVWRKEVLQYLDAVGQDYRADSTNADSRFTRNRIRLELLPALRAQYNAEVDEALARLAQQADEAQQVISLLAAELVDQCVTVQPSTPQQPPKPGTAPAEPLAAESVQIDCRPLADQPPLLVREVCKAAWQQARWPLQAMGFEHWQRLVELVCCAESAPLDLPGGVHAQRRGDTLKLRLP
jgi:tRNA(Ile)-lysidine synthase